MRVSKQGKYGAAFLAALILIVPPAMADKPEWAGGPHEKKQEKKHERKYDKQQAQRGTYFTDQQRMEVHEYYHGRYGAKKKCPPGLAKKNQGCVPPGQAKKWQLHKPLPADIAYYSVPHSLAIKIGVPPAGHRYVRIGADILLIAVGTNMVVDAITDIMQQ